MGTHRSYRERTFAFGNLILMLRTRAALTQRALTDELGVHIRSVQNWEAGESYPKADTLQRLIVVFLRHQVWEPGSERAEAQALWSLAASDGPHALAIFDEAWFAALQDKEIRRQGDTGTRRHGDTEIGDTAHGTGDDRSRSPGLQVSRSRGSGIIDWGEAIAVPTLYGRAQETETLQRWIVDDRCRVIAIVGLGGIGKSSLAITVAQQLLAQFDLVLFRSLQNGLPLAELLDDIIHTVSDHQATPPEHVPDKIALLVQLFRERRCLMILDNLEAILQPGVLTGSYRSGYDEYGILLRVLSEREHASCLLLTSREKPAEIGPLEGHSAPVRTLNLSGLDDSTCRIILASKDLVGTATDLAALARLYGGNPLALSLVAEPIRELFGGDVSVFLAHDDAFFNGVGKLLDQQFARSTALEQGILYWLAINRELVPLNALLVDLGDALPRRAVLAALDSLRRRMLIERAPDRPAFTLQPVILEYVTDQLAEIVCRELLDTPHELLQSHALIQATAKEYVRRSQERLIARPLLERLLSALGDTDAVERQLLTLVASWREQPPLAQGYGPGNVVNLLRLLRDNLRSLDLSRLALRSVYLQDVDMQAVNLSSATMRDSVFTETFDAILAVAISGDGEYWAAASRRGEVLIWAAGGLILRQSWRAHADMIWTVAFSPDGRTLASGSWDNLVKLWDVSSGALLWSGRHTSHVNSIAFAPDGRTLASGGDDATVRLWDVQNGVQLQVLPHPGPVCGAGVSWSPDGRRLASGDLQGSLRVWELHPIGQATCVLMIAAHTHFVDGLAFSRDGGSLASASWDGLVKLWDAGTGELRATLAGHTDGAGRVAWSPDNTTLASAGTDPTIRLWNVPEGTQRAALHGHTSGVCGLAFTPDGRSLLSCGDGTLRMWDIASGQCMRVIHGYADFLYVVDWSPDGTQLVSGGMDRLVTIWNVSAATPPRMLHGHGGSVCGVGWSPNGQWLASAEWNNTIRLWNAAAGTCLQVLQHTEDPDNFFYDLIWSPDGQRFASGTSRRGVYVFDLTTQRQAWAGPAFPTFIRHVAWSPDGRYLAGGGDDGSVYVWDANDGALLQQLTGHHGMITSVAWSAGGTQLGSGSSGINGGELFIWDARRGERVASLQHPEIVSAIAWSADEQLLVSGSGDGQLRWWDVQRGVCTLERAAHQGTVQALRRSPDATQVASCADDGAITIWNLDTGAYLRTLWRERPYERMNITGLTGVTPAQRASLIALGAVEGITAG